MHGLADRSTEILRSGWPIDSQIFSSRQQTANRRSGISQPAAKVTATLTLAASAAEATSQSPPCSWSRYEVGLSVEEVEQSVLPA